MRSVRAIRLSDDPAVPKRLPPGGHRAAGLVLADALALHLLAGASPDALPRPLRVLFVEGEPDFLTWASRFSDADEDAPAIFGVLSGSWTPSHAARIPDGAIAIIRTHNDAAGDGYAAAVERSLAKRCVVLQSKGQA